MTTKFQTAARFPWYVRTDADRAEIAWWCPNELDAWREAVRFHKSLKDNAAKMENRKNLEAAYDALREAYTVAINQPMLAA